MKTIIGIQDDYIQAVVAAAAKWAHRRCPYDKTRPGGHFTRTRRGAYKKAIKQFKALGFAEATAEQMVADASDVAKLEINAE